MRRARGCNPMFHPIFCVNIIMVIMFAIFVKHYNEDKAIAVEVQGTFVDSYETEESDTDDDGNTTTTTVTHYRYTYTYKGEEYKSTTRSYPEYTVGAIHTLQIRSSAPDEIISLDNERLRLRIMIYVMIGVNVVMILTTMITNVFLRRTRRRFHQGR